MASLVFLSHRAPDAVPQLQGELARRGLRVDDLLRLRLFAAERAHLLEMARELERLLPRSQWPALSTIELAADGAATPALDAIAAPRAHETRVAVREAATRRTGPGRVLGPPEGMRFGPWLFVGAVSAPAAGGSDLPDRIEAQSRELFARMERLLRVGRTELRHVVKVGGWLSFPMSEYEPLGRVRDELLERSGLLPASASVQTGPIFDLAAEGLPTGSAGAAPLLSFEAIAFVPQRLPPQPSSREPPPAAPSPLAPFYASAHRAGDYVFTCGEIPRRPAPVEQEARDVCEQLHVHLAEHGALPQDVVQQTVFVRHSHHAPVVERELAAWAGTEHVVTTVVPTIDMGFRPGVNVEVETIAEIPTPARA